jgi:starch synthase
VPQAKIQVYFIDNEDFFTRKATVKDENGEYFEDNDERAMFFGRGVLETVKKLGWKPDIIHCHGWMTALTPLYIKKLYQNDPHFADAKVVYSVYNNPFNKNWDAKFHEKLKFDGFDEADLTGLKDVDFVALNKMAMEVSDGIVQGSSEIDEKLQKVIEDSNIPFLEYYSEETCVKPMNEFYDQIFEEIVV